MDFLRGYERHWRLSKLLLIQALLKDRSKVRTELQAGFGAGLPCDDAYVYGPVTNGLLFSGVAELTMLAEDLLALVKFIRSRESFARSLAHYDAGAVTNLAGTLREVPDERLLSAFMVPTSAMIGDVPTKTVDAYTKGVATLLRFARAASTIYERYVYLYNQYKHGLTVALHPFGGGRIPDDLLTRRKASLSGAVVGYAARSITKSQKGRA